MKTTMLHGMVPMITAQFLLQLRHRLLPQAEAEHPQIQGDHRAAEHRQGEQVEALDHREHPQRLAHLRPDEGRFEPLKKGK